MMNREVAAVFEGIADLLELKDDNPFKIRAYRRAALNIQNMSEDIEAIARNGKLDNISGVGKDLAAKIEEIIKTGGLRFYEKLKRGVPQGMIDMMSIPGIGPKTAKLIYKKLGIKTIEQLEAAARKHKISRLPGMKVKTEENILRGIGLVSRRMERMTLKEAVDISEEVMGLLKSLPHVDRISTAGSLRRMKETVRDIDILITSRDPDFVMGKFTKLKLVKDIVAYGSTKSIILTDYGVQVDLRIVKPESFGAALVYFTGSQAHNIHIRHIAKNKGLKVNEYGVFVEKTKKRLCGKEEADVYKALKFDFIPPELREDRGEIEAAARGALPKLVEIGDIKGDFHVHSEYSDGEDKIQDIAEACKEIGYKYVVITDHSQSLKVAGGLDKKEVFKKLEEVHKANSKMRGFRILSGTEVDILSNGHLDYDEGLLKEFDVVVAAVHSGFKQPKEAMTSRLLKAMDNRHLHIIAHPTGRLFGKRESYEVDFDRVFKSAKQRNICLEVNAYPDRLDLDDVNSRAAMEAGVKIVLGTDAHAIGQLKFMKFGLSVARRGWLKKDDIINSMSLDELLKFIKK